MGCCCCCEVTSDVSNSVPPLRRQPTRLPRPWDSPGKNTGVGCHFLLQCMKVKSESEVAQLPPTLSDLMDYSLPGPSSMGFSRQEYWSGTHVQKTMALACSESVVFGPVTSRGHDIYTCPFGGWVVPTSLNWLELGNS